MALEAYRPILANPQVRTVLLGAGINGIGTGLPLAVILAVNEEHSIGSAGLIVAVMAVASAASSPIRGRLVDRRGHALLRPLGIAQGSLVIAFGLATPHFSVAPLAALAALMEVVRAPLFASLRALWQDIVEPGPELDAAYSLHAILNELLFIAGPLVVGAAVALGSPQDAVIVIGVCNIVGVLIFTAAPLSRAWAGRPAETGLFGALESPGMRTLTLANVGMGFVFGALDVGAAASASELGTAGAAGLALAALAAGSALGGVAYGAHRWTIPIERRYVAFTGLVLIGLLPLGLASSIPLLIALMALAGIAVAPWVAVEFAMLDRVAPRGTATEAMTWIVTTYSIGIAAGAFLVGQIAAGGETRLALLASAAGAAFALVVTVVGFRTLQPAK